MCIFGSHTFVPISWMCKKQTSVSHSSTESEIISLDAGLRLDGIPALDMWDLIVFVLGKTIQIPDRSGQPDVNGDKDHGSNKRSQGMTNVLKNIDCVRSNVIFSHQEALLYVFEDNEAVIKMITNCSEAMAKRLQQDSGEERVTAKSRPMMSLIARVPSNVSSSTSVSPAGETRCPQRPKDRIRLLLS